jgi:hypothetical protein
VAHFGSYWRGVTGHLHRSIATALERWRGIIRFHGWMIALGALLAIPGIMLARDRASRNGIALLFGCAVVQLVGSVLLIGYGFRYGIPPAILLVVVGGRSAELIAQRVGPAVLARRRTIMRWA